MLALLGMLPGIGSIVQSLVQKFFDTKVALATARIGGDTAVAQEMVKATATSQASIFSAASASNILLLVIAGFALPYIVYEWKCVVWDTVLDMGSTAPIRGQIADWATTIIGSIFASGTILSVGHMYFSRNG